MNQKIKTGIICLLVLCLSSVARSQNKAVLPDKLSNYVGRYSLRTDLVLEVKRDGDLLTLLPSFWGSAVILNPIAKDKFASLLHPRMKFEFGRDENGKVISLISSGNRELNGTARRLKSDDLKVVEYLLSGNAKEAIKKLENSDEKVSERRIVRLGFNMLRFRPSMAKVALSFTSAFEPKFQDSVDLQHVLGLAALMNKNEKKAAAAFRKALKIDPSNSMSQAAVRLLDSQENAPSAPADSWKLPFDIDELFQKPSEDEIKKVRSDWNKRDLSVKNVKIEFQKDKELSGRKYTVQIISHTVQGHKHFGAVLIPKGAKPGKSPIVLELHGVNSSYSPFNVRKAKTPKILGKNSLNAIIAIPAFRGNTLILDDQKYVSEGSATDAWDGATDDALAFLNVVADKVSEADKTRISAFGKSRGGTVALLAGVRDKRVGSVIAWAGPSGWFSNMGTFGWSLQQQVQWGLWEKWKPGRGWGSSSQFIDWFLTNPIQKQTPSLKKVRHQILASSPLYFLENLPVAQLHYGVNDGSVPIINALEIKKALEARDKSAPDFTLFMHKDAGHDQPYPRAFKLSREFLHKHFSRHDQ